MASLNKIILIGRLTNNPEIRTTVDGVPLARFQLSVERRNMGAASNTFDLIDIIAWGALSEYIQTNLSKGSIALVEGRIQNRSFESSDGSRIYLTEVVASNVLSLDTKKSPKIKQEVAKQEPEEEIPEEDIFSEDLPF